MQDTVRLWDGYPDRSPHLVSTVKELQRRLSVLGFVLLPDGAFGPVTESAVLLVQRRFGLSDDGIVGPKTWAVLLRPPRGFSTSSGAPTKRSRELAPTVPMPPPSGAQSEPRWMEIARREAGQKEVKGAGVNDRIIEYHAATSLSAGSDETPWCSSFVNWCMTQAGLRGTRSAAAASWIGWGVAVEPRYGAVMVIHNSSAANSSLSSTGNHVGFLVEQTLTHYVVLGGNQSDSVKVSSFARTKWKQRAMRWPG